MFLANKRLNIFYPIITRTELTVLETLVEQQTPDRWVRRHFGKETHCKNQENLALLLSCANFTKVPHRLWSKHVAEHEKTEGAFYRLMPIGWPFHTPLHLIWAWACKKVNLNEKIQTSKRDKIWWGWWWFPGSSGPETDAQTERTFLLIKKILYLERC